MVLRPDAGFPDSVRSWLNPASEKLLHLPQASRKVVFLVCVLGVGGTQFIHTVNRLVVDRGNGGARWVKGVKITTCFLPTSGTTTLLP